MSGVWRSTALAALSGFLMRPCCVVPAALPLVGVVGAGVGATLVAHRGPLLAASAVVLFCSLWINFRREGGWLNRTLAVSSAAIAFTFAAGVW